MITVIAEFKLPQPITNQQAREIFLSTAPKYQGMPGLIRKYYFLTPDGIKAGGIYLWQSREDADNLYTEEWKGFVRGKYGSDPTLTYLRPLLLSTTSLMKLSRTRKITVGSVRKKRSAPVNSGTSAILHKPPTLSSELPGHLAKGREWYTFSHNQYNV